MKKVQRPYVVEKKSKGRTYYYFRRGEIYQRLPDTPDSREFDEAYWAIRSGREKKLPKTTFGNLIDSYYASPAFKGKKPRTQQEYRRTLERIRESNGDKDFTKLRRRDVIAARDKYSDTWRKANGYVEMLSILAKHAIDKEWITANPCSGVKKLEGGEYQPWPEDKLRAYERYCLEHNLSWELTAFQLGIGTGQRIGDLIKMEWAHYDGQYIAVVQEKTSTRLWVACPDFLRDHLDSLERSGKFIISQSLHKGVAKRTIQQRVMAVREAVGALEYVIHGWRYTAAVALAEAGASDSEIQAVTGHKTLEMVRKYRNQANQKLLSLSAQSRRTRT